MKSIAPLTKRQREVYDFLGKFVKQFGFAPSLEEIGAAMGLSSLATVHKHLENLREKGYINRLWNRSRYLELRGDPGCCPTCGRALEKSLDEAKVSLETGRKVEENKAVEKGLAGPIPT